MKLLSILTLVLFLGCKGKMPNHLSETPLEESFDSIRAERGLSIQAINSTEIDSLTHLVDSLKKELDTAYLPWFRKGVVMDCSHTSVVKWNKNIKVHLSKKDFVLIIDRKKDSIIIDNNLDQ